MINPMMRSQPTRMMGLASGMDTDFIIQQTLRMHQFKIDNRMRDRKLLEWRQQTHNGIKDEISKLRSTFLSSLGSKSMMSRNVFNATAATITGNSANAVSIRTNAGSPLGNFTINRVEQLAKGAHLTTAVGASANGNGFATGATLGSLDFKNGGAITWTRDGGNVRVGTQDIRIERTHGVDSKESLKFFNAAGVDITNSSLVSWNDEGSAVTITTGGTTRTLNWDAEKNQLTENRQGVFAYSDFEIPDGDGTRKISITATQNQSTGAWSFSSSAGRVSLNEETGMITLTTGSGASERKHDIGEWVAGAKTIDGKTLEQQTNLAVQLVGETDLTFNTGSGDVNVRIRASDTLSEMITRVNNSTAGVSMSYDRLSDQFTLESRTGASINPATSELGIFSNSNFFNLIRGDVSKLTTEGTESTVPIVRGGQQAIAWINDQEVRSNTNSFDFRGVNLTLNRLFDSADEGVEAISVNLARDTNQAFNAIKEFIDNYNSIIAKLEGLLNERKTGNEASYRPLTDEEKLNMTDRQIEEWEAIAKKGILRNDNGIQNLVSSLRRTFFEQIEGVGISPAQIGLTTGSFFDGTGGQIMIDEEKLRGAIERDPDMVADIFIRIDTSGPSARGVGLLHKVDGLMREYVNTTQTTSIKNLEDSLKRTNEQIQKMQERMYAEEDRLYRQFAAMESAMSKLNQQGDWFNAMLGG